MNLSDAMKKFSPEFGHYFEPGVKRIVDDEVEKITKEATERIRKKLSEAITSIVIMMFRQASFERFNDDLVIHVKMDALKNDSLR